MDPLLRQIAAKLLSARFWLAIGFGVTACMAFLKGIMSTDAFLGLAGGVITGYQLKSRQ